MGFESCLVLKKAKVRKCRKENFKFDRNKQILNILFSKDKDTW